MSKNTVDYSGQTFFELTAIEFSHIDRWGHRFWKWQCSCGKECIESPSRVRAGRKKSCGHLYYTHKGERAVAYSVWYKFYRDGDLSFELFWSMCKLDCFYCGAAPANRYRGKSKTHTFVYNGVDRLDNDRPHDVGNCLPCCWRCNAAKNDMCYVDFVEHCRKVVERCGYAT